MFATAFLLALTPAATPTVIDVTTYASACKAGEKVCLAAIDHAIDAARKAIAKDPATVYTITLPAGKFDMSKDPATEAKGAIDVSDIRPSTGALNLAGAGMDKTTLITSNDLETIFGRNVAHIHISGMTFMRDAPTVSQGRIIASAPGQLTMEIPEGFPTPLQLFNGVRTQGRYLRVYDNSNPLDPQMNTDLSNSQISWGDREGHDPPTGSGRVWTLYLKSKDPLPGIYTAKNQIACIKIKSEGSGYSFSNTGGAAGTDIGFDHVRFLDVSRGVWRNITGAYMTNSIIERRPPVKGQAFCISSPGGGPQFGQPNDEKLPMGGNRVDHLTVQAPGDDGIAFFNDSSGTSSITNSHVENSFARNINLYRSANVKLSNNTFRGCVPDGKPDSLQSCVVHTDEEHAAKHAKGPQK